MATRTRAKAALKGKAGLRAEIVEAMQGLHKIGAVSDAELAKTTLRMLGRDALPKVADLSPADIVKMRKQEGVSQAVLAGLLNFPGDTGSHWGGGQRRPPPPAFNAP